MELNLLERILDGQEKPCNVDLALLRTITEDFSEDKIIGSGGCGLVYKGVLQNGNVAVKRLSQNHTIDDNMFNQEVYSLMMVEHKNIVRILGYCSDTQEHVIEINKKFVMGQRKERLLCFEYVSKGSLDNYIKDELTGLEWIKRYQIIKGICEGLHHLHKEKGIRHMDLKPANILLGDDMIPKITDFGLARLDEKSQTTSKDFLVSLGYCAPEYRDHGKMSAKADIYSLGVIIGELVTGSRQDPNIQKALQRWRHRWIRLSARTQELWYQQIAKCLDLATWCTQESPMNRPNIWDIIRELNEIDSWDGQIRYATVSTLNKIMSTLEDMLQIEPLEMHFPFALDKQTSCSIKLTNDTEDYFVFRIGGTGLLSCDIKPEKGIVGPQSTGCATITLHELKQAPQRNYRNEEFIVQSCRVDGSLGGKDVSGDMLTNEGGKVVDEVNLRVVFDMPPTPEKPRNKNAVALEPVRLSQADRRSEILFAPTILEYTGYADASIDKLCAMCDVDFHMLERILDGNESPRRLNFSLLKFITNDFSDDRNIGAGGIAAVYKGILRDGRIVAVKNLFKSHTIEENLFHQEVTTMMRVEHQNIVRCLGYCSHTEEEAVEIRGRTLLAQIRERLLCFEYISNGSLDHHLTDELRGLDWPTRYQILKGICEAVHHLHKERHILHMDLKPSNILLDNHMVPKVSGFSRSRLDDKSQTMTVDRLVSPGYCAPEYLNEGKMSAKSDIYSLGVIIGELVTGTMKAANIENVLRRWRHRWNKSGNYTSLWGKQVNKCLELAQSCTSKDPVERPFIWDIILDLDESEQMPLRLSHMDAMLGIEPLDLHFPVEHINEQLSHSVQLTNNTDDYIAFRIATTSLLQFRTEPDKGVVLPLSRCVVTITIEEIPDRHKHLCEEFTVTSTRVEEDVTTMDVTEDTFSEEPGKIVDTVNLTVTFDDELELHED